MKTAEIQLPYFKQGDDFAHALKESGSLSRALDRHMFLLQDAIQILRDVQGRIVTSMCEDRITMDGDTHMITITGPDDFIQELVDLKLASTEIFDEMDDMKESDECDCPDGECHCQDDCDCDDDDCNCKEEQK